MSRYPEIALLVAASILAGCGGLPGSAPFDESTVAQQSAADTAEQSSAEPGAEPTAVVPEPEPIDYNQQFYEQAVSALKRGDPGLAIELLQTVSRDAPGKPFVFTNLGLAYFQLQQDELAMTAFRQAVDRNPDDAVAYNHLGVLQRRQGLFEAARESYQRALEIDSNYALAHLNLGILFDIYLQNLEPALRHYQRYQALQDGANETVSGWIVDLERRLKSATS